MQRAAVLLGVSLLLSTGLATTALPESRVTISHDDGTTTVNKNPRRVAVIGEEALELAYALNIPVVGLGSGRVEPGDFTLGATLTRSTARRGFLGRGDLSNVTYLGSWAAPNLEVLTALKPDLIVRTSWDGLGGYAALNAIAPTLSFSQSKPDFWPRSLRAVAKVFGKEAQAETIIRGTAATITAAGSSLRAAGIFKKFPKMVVLSPFPDGTVYRYTGDRLANVLRQMGFRDGLAVRPDNNGYEVISPEALLGLDASTLVVLVPWSSGGDIFAKSSAGKLLAARSVTYQLPEFSPWTGPLVDRDVAQKVAAAARTLLGK
ncbi:ABC transporter substrate-binding protein [Deinococcus ruber]|uniref:Iron ABC transporter substrate-binding protein n=1 Tax=Deinococcus ruber TaxID=1848197 RepID=A0A918FA82_9DEIO|nr:ABC transporter substrate-binding protein [Deinococcus ruber]GGR23975.1 iron ABC transporter substrate-binding protein [Deinococcus ruber]